MAAKDSDDQKPEAEENEHSLDMSQAAIKRMIADARERGYITYDQLNQALPPEQVSSEQIEDVMSMLSEMGINVIEEEEAEEGEGGAVVEVSTSREVAVATATGETLDRTDDPVRMYLREMGSVELLSREGEIAIAKRIEAGRNTMIAGLCESPLTFQAITIWRDELLNEDILLRDVIDLEATFGRSLDGDGDMDGPVIDEVDMSAAAPAAPRQGGDEPELDADGNPILRAEEEDEDDDGSNMSLAAMEAALKPQVLDTLEVIARDYATLAEMQDLRMSATLNEDGSFSKADEAAYQKLRSEIVLLVNGLHLHNNRIEALIDQLYGINRKIMQLDSNMVKLADAARINRREFIDEYRGYELDPQWLDRMAAKAGRGWQALIEKSRDKVEEAPSAGALSFVGATGRLVWFDCGWAALSSPTMLTRTANRSPAPSPPGVTGAGAADLGAAAALAAMAVEAGMLAQGSKDRLRPGGMAPAAPAPCQATAAPTRVNHLSFEHSWLFQERR